MSFQRLYDVLKRVMKSFKKEHCRVRLEAFFLVFFFQAEDGIRDRSPSRGLGDVYKRQEFVKMC